VMTRPTVWPAKSQLLAIIASTPEPAASLCASLANLSVITDMV
jgi:hypothetical protein